MRLEDAARKDAERACGLGRRARPPRRSSHPVPRSVFGRPLRLEVLEGRLNCAADGVADFNHGIVFQDATTRDVWLSEDNGLGTESRVLDLGRAPDVWLDPIQADMDGDGLEDWVVFGQQTGEWWLIRRNASGLWTPAKAMQWSPDSVRNLLAGDIDGDGRDEIIAQSEYLSWWMLDFAGESFQNVALGFMADDAIDQAFVLDTNGDGKDELLGWSGDSGFWTRIDVDASGIVSQARVGHWNPAGAYQSFQIGDVHGDGGDEVFALDAWGDWWALTARSGAFCNQQLVNEVPDVDRVYLAGDWTGDGAIDLVWFANGHWNVGSFSGETPAIASYASSGFADRPSAMQFADWNGDGAADLLTMGAAGGFYGTTLADGRSTTVPIEWETGPVDARRLSAVDIDADGRMDLVGVSDSGMWWALANRGPRVAAIPLESEAASRAAWIGRFTQANEKELVIWDARSGEMTKRAVRGGDVESMRIASVATRSVEGGIADIALGAFRADSPADLVFRDDAWNWFIVPGDSLYSPIGRIWLGRNGGLAGVPRIGDFDGDARDEWMSRDEVTGIWWMIEFDGGRYTLAPAAHWSVAAAYPRIFVANVLEGPAKELVGQDSTGSWWATYFNGSWYANRHLVGWSPETSWDWIDLADFDGDGRDEILGHDTVWREWTLVDSVEGVFQNRYMGRTTIPIEPARTARGDTNGDGKDDAVSIDSDGTLFAFLATGDRIESTVLARLPFFGTWDQPVIADLDGNGTAEVWLRDAATGDIFEVANGVVRRAGVESGPHPSASGPGSWAPRVTDYDGNGRDDLIVWNPGFGHIEHISLRSDGAFLQNATSHDMESYVASSSGRTSLNTIGTFRQRVIRESAHLDAWLDADPLLAANAITDWVANHADYDLDGTMRQPLAEHTTADALYYDVYARNIGGGYCLSYALMVLRTLSAFGANSVIVSYGIQGSDLTHTAVVVGWESDGTWNHYLLEPTFNVTYVDAQSGSVLSLRELLTRWTSDRQVTVSAQQHPNELRDWLSHGPANKPGIAFVDQRDGVFRYRFPGYGLERYLGIWASYYEAVGLTADLDGFVRLMMRSVLVVDSYSTESALVQSLVELFDEFGVPTP